MLPSKWNMSGKCLLVSSLILIVSADLNNWCHNFDCHRWRGFNWRSGCNSDCRPNVQKALEIPAEPSEVENIGTINESEQPAAEGSIDADTKISTNSTTNGNETTIQTPVVAVDSSAINASVVSITQAAIPKAATEAAIDESLDGITDAKASTAAMNETENVAREALSAPSMVLPTYEPSEEFLNGPTEVLAERITVESIDEPIEAETAATMNGTSNTAREAPTESFMVLPTDKSSEEPTEGSTQTSAEGMTVETIDEPITRSADETANVEGEESANGPTEAPAERITAESTDEQTPSSADGITNVARDASATELSMILPTKESIENTVKSEDEASIEYIYWGQ